MESQDKSPKLQNTPPDRKRLLPHWTLGDALDFMETVTTREEAVGVLQTMVEGLWTGQGHHSFDKSLDMGIGNLRYAIERFRDGKSSDEMKVWDDLLDYIAKEKKTLSSDMKRALEAGDE